MTVQARQDNNFNFLTFNDVDFQTRSFNNDKFDRKVHSKGLTIYIDKADKDLVESFGMTVYDNTESAKDTKEDIVYFVMLNFSGKTTVYDTQNMTRTRKVMDDTIGNFHGSHYDIAVMKFENTASGKSNDFYFRAVSLKGNPQNLEMNAINYFGDDDKFMEVAQADIIPADDAPQIDENGQTPEMKQVSEDSNNQAQ